MGGNATKNYVDRHSSGGGGGGGTTNYNELENKPSINGVVLSGNKTSTDLHIESGGGGYNFSNITLVEENANTGEPITAEVENGFIIALYTNYSDGNNYWYFYTLPKELLNLVPSGKNAYGCFVGSDKFGFQNITRNNNTYTFTFFKEADGRRMNVYKF